MRNRMSFSERKQCGDPRWGFNNFGQRCIAVGRRKGGLPCIKELVPLELLEMYARNVSFSERKNAVNVSLFHWK
jgi:hypothetical protein